MEGDGERLNSELQKTQEKLNFLEEEQERLLNECAQLEDQLAHESGLSRNHNVRLNDLIRQRDSLVAILEKGLADLDSLRRAIADITQQCLEKENHIRGLEQDIQAVENELGAAEAQNQSLVEELQR